MALFGRGADDNGRKLNEKHDQRGQHVGNLEQTRQPDPGECAHTWGGKIIEIIERTKQDLSFYTSHLGVGLT